MSSFRKDEREMARKGWTTEGFTARQFSRGPLRRIMNQRPAGEVDVHYMRADWVDEA